MKATELIRALANTIAEHGDLEVFAYSPNGSTQLARARESFTHVTKVQPAKGTRTLYVTAAKAQELGYDPDGDQHGIVLG
ncbi:MAG: hypothetical protein IAE66_06295 [Xanthomonadaceae bacterium]|nr:hypothetical protein [Xanthomonadaceae bacterium]